MPSSICAAGFAWHGCTTRHLLEESAAIAERCTFSLDELHYEYPEEVVPAGETHAGYLRRMVQEGIKVRYPEGAPDAVTKQIDYELQLISELHYESYFLTVFDIVRFARSNDILCQGRGSAANSAVCYCLGVTEVDPARGNLLFERFISRERGEPPDIDVDFEHQRREEVIQYIYRRYGRHRAALAATVISYRPRSAIRDVGRAFGIDLQRLNRLSSSHAWWDGGGVQSERLLEHGFDPDSPVIQKLIAMVEPDAALSTPSVTARRRLCHQPRQAVSYGTDRKCCDGRSLGDPVGQGRLWKHSAC